ncbi:sigma-54-dependent transcriptional regulator [candidate division KSB1 bacterium]
MRILLVDDDKALREAVAEFLENQLGHHVTQCENGQEGFNIFETEPFPMVISDIRMPGIDGIEFLQNIKSLPEGRTADVILLTGFGDMKTAIKALRSGAYDFLLKPCSVEELAAVVERVVEHQSLLKDNLEFKTRFEEKLVERTGETRSRLKELQNAYAEVIGVGRIGVFSPEMREVVSICKKLHQDRSVPVLIEGESGTGKEIIAKLIHYGEGDVVAPFVPINCSAISSNLFESELFGYEPGAFTGAKKEGQKGKLESAQGGTLFLDEIGEMPPEMQPKLLRVLQEKEIYRVGGIKKIELDVRIICATNRNLAEMVDKGEFRRDLFYRLNIGRVFIPPLRERKNAIGPLAQMFLKQFSEQKKRGFKVLNKKALKVLEAHDWQGNVRELQNAIERVILLYDDVELKPEHLDFLADAGDKAAEEKPANSLNLTFPADSLSLNDIEADIIKAVLKMFDDNKSRAASYLGITRTTLRNKLNSK